MYKKILIYFLIIMFCLLYNSYSLAWDDEITHKDLSQKAAESSVLGAQTNYLQNLGFTKGLKDIITWNGVSHEVFEWVRDGAQIEDERTSILPTYGVMRSVNHFHNPTRTWYDSNPQNLDAGLDDWVLFLHYTGESSLLWAQDKTNQENHVGGDWSWKTIRDKYYWALTDTTEAQRQMNFAQTFKGLGHQMHLIQDGAVPDHIRNDAHPFKRNKYGGLTLEAWAVEKVIL